VIIGAGFGGLECAKRLSGKPVDVLLLDRNNYHLFTPLLYQVASSLLNPSDIAYPVRSVLRGSRNVRFRLADVSGVDFGQRVVRLATGEVIGYDYLVIATGSTTHYFGIRSVGEVANGLKDLPEAIALRTHVLRAFEEAVREPDLAAREAWLRFVVVGGGPTGVEYAGALVELIHLVMARDYPELDLSAARVILVEALERVLPAFKPPLGDHATDRLRRLGVEVRLNTRLVEASPKAVTLSTGEVIPARTLVWAAGVEASDLAAGLGITTAGQGRVPVDENLRIEGHRNVFAIGDIAAVRQRGDVLPMIAQPAIQGGDYVADAILGLEAGRALKPFKYWDKGIMATIGRNAGVAQVGKLSFKGTLGWYAWLVLHLYFIIGFRNRLAVLISWAWNYVFYDRPIRLITQGKGGDLGD
jgi:NADH dehydrogenase